MDISSDCSKTSIGSSSAFNTSKVDKSMGSNSIDETASKERVFFGQHEIKQVDSGKAIFGRRDSFQESFSSSSISSVVSESKVDVSNQEINNQSVIKKQKKKLSTIKKSTDSYQSEAGIYVEISENDPSYKKIAAAFSQAAKVGGQATLCIEKILSKTTERNSILSLLRIKAERSSRLYIRTVRDYQASGAAPKNLTAIMNKLSANQQLGLEGIMDIETRKKINELLQLRKESHAAFQAMAEADNKFIASIASWEKAAEAYQEYFDVAKKLAKAELLPSVSLPKFAAMMTIDEHDPLAQRTEGCKAIAECYLKVAEASDRGAQNEVKLWKEAAQAFDHAAKAKNYVNEVNGIRRFFSIRAANSFEKHAHAKIKAARAATPPDGIEVGGIAKKSEKKWWDYFSFFGRSVQVVSSERPSVASLMEKSHSKENISLASKPASEKASSKESGFYENVAAAFKGFSKLGLFRRFI